MLFRIAGKNCSARCRGTARLCLWRALLFRIPLWWDMGRGPGIAM